MGENDRIKHTNPMLTFIPKINLI